MSPPTSAKCSRPRRRPAQPHARWRVGGARRGAFRGPWPTFCARKELGRTSGDYIRARDSVPVTKTCSHWDG